jgi:phenylacetate-CoA ligase
MGFIHDNIYPFLPIPLQNLAISAFGYTWHKRRFGGIFESELKGYKERESYTHQQLQDYQTIQLRKVLTHAFNTVPYYRELYQLHDFTAAQLEQFELSDISKLPALEKDTLRQFGKTTLLSSVREKGGEFYASSGSTGTPTSIMYSYAMHQRISASYEARVRHWAGVNHFDARAMIGGRRIIKDGTANPPFYRYNFIEKQVYLSAYHISEQTAADYLNGLIKHNTQYMVGYAMSNFILARFFKELGLKAPQMKAVITSSEKLTQAMRAVLEEVYQCKSYDGWSGVENCGLISENEHRQLLLSSDTALIEILKADGKPAGPGEIGELYCTGFLNYDQPLIRYRIGDMVQLAANQHTICGRPFPVIEEIIGRVEDTVIGKDGREMVRFHGIFVNLPNVVKGQVVQEDLDVFTVNVATKGLTAEERQLIQQRMESQLGNIKLTINELVEIPVGNNGKFKAVISHVKRHNKV